MLIRSDVRCYCCLYPYGVSDSVITGNYTGKADSAVGQAQKRKEQSFVLCRVVIPWVACTPTTPLVASLVYLQKWMFQKHFASYFYSASKSTTYVYQGRQKHEILIFRS
jgi:hypothetical protein